MGLLTFLQVLAVEVSTHADHHSRILKRGEGVVGVEPEPVSLVIRGVIPSLLSGLILNDKLETESVIIVCFLKVTLVIIILIHVDELREGERHLIALEVTNYPVLL